MHSSEPHKKQARLKQRKKADTRRRDYDTYAVDTVGLYGRDRREAVDSRRRR